MNPEPPVLEVTPLPTEPHGHGPSAPILSRPFLFPQIRFRLDLTRVKPQRSFQPPFDVQNDDTNDDDDDDVNVETDFDVLQHSMMRYSFEGQS